MMWREKEVVEGRSSVQCEGRVLKRGRTGRGKVRKRKAEDD